MSLSTPTHRSIFLHSLQLSASAFGGGYVLISLMRRLYTERLGWLTEEEMLDIAVLSQTAPGASAVNAAVLSGYKLHGISGAATAVAGTILPPLLIMSLLAALYTGLRNIAVLSKFLTGMQCGVAAVLLHTVAGMTRSALKKPLHVILFVLFLLWMLL
ncbi:MAG: chromate transporter [Eubacteriales bacterium]